MLVLRKNWEINHSLVEQAFLHLGWMNWHQPYHGWYKSFSINCWIFHLLLISVSSCLWLFGNSSESCNVETETTNLLAKLFYLSGTVLTSNPSIHNLKAKLCDFLLEEAMAISIPLSNLEYTLPKFLSHASSIFRSLKFSFVDTRNLSKYHSFQVHSFDE